MTWVNGRRLSTLSKGGVTTSYTYNDSGIRTKKTVGSTVTEYFVEGGLLLGQKQGSSVLQFLYDGGGQLYGFLYNGTPYYYVYNGQGDVVRVLDQYGETEVIYTYDAWGKQLSQKDTAGSSIPSYAASDIANINPIRYRGYYYDLESGFYYLQSRYYDPTTGRFINADGYVSTGQGMTGTNMFAYCGNNPVNCVDPSGNCPYKPTMEDFHRLEQGLPPAGCTCGTAISNAVVVGINPRKPPDHPNYKPPKKGDKRVKNPNGEGTGWVDKNGEVWVYTPKMHGGEGWTVQNPDGGHWHAYPGGGVRKATKVSNFWGGLATAGVAAVAIFFIIANDATIIGAADDGAMAPAAGCFAVGWDQMWSSSYYCEDCGQMWEE